MNERYKNNGGEFQSKNVNEIHTSGVNIWIFGLSIVSILVTVYCMAFVDNQGYRNLYILPLTMAISILVIHRVISATANRIPFLAFYCIAYLRYVLLPLLMVQSGFYNSRYYPDATDSAANTGIFLMQYELISYTILLSLYKKKLLKLKVKLKSDIYDNKTGGFAFVAAVSIIAFVCVYCLMNGLSLRISVLMFYLPATNNVFVIGESFLNAASAMLFVLILNAWKRSKRKIQQNVIFLFGAVAWICICFGDARMSYVIKAVVIMGILLQFMNRKVAKKAIGFISVVAIVCIVAITLLDDSANHGLFYFTATDSQKNTYAHVLQTYFSGPYNVAKSVEVSWNFTGNGFSQFITDIFYNAYPWSTFLPNDAVPTKTLFNEHLYGYSVSGSQIVPLIGQGVIIFGPIFSVIPPLLCLYLLIETELKSNRKLQHRSMTSYFVAEYTAAYLGFFQMYNLIIIFGFLLNTVLLMNIVSYIQDHVKIGNGYHLKVRQ